MSLLVLSVEVALVVEAVEEIISLLVLTSDSSLLLTLMEVEVVSNTTSRSFLFLVFSSNIFDSRFSSIASSLDFIAEVSSFIISPRRLYFDWRDEVLLFDEDDGNEDEDDDDDDDCAVVWSRAFFLFISAARKSMASFCYDRGRLVWDG